MNDLINNNIEKKFLHIGPMGHCWVSEKESLNRYGISYEIPETLIDNKKLVNYGDNEVEVRKTDTGYEVLSVLSRKKTQLISVYVAKKNSFLILNSQMGKFFQYERNDGKQLYNNDIFLFEKNGDEYALKKFIGNIKKNGIETEIMMLIGDIQDNKIDLQNKKWDTKNYPFMDIPFFTIDGKHTKDIDDAIAFEKTEKGFIFHVAIADVSSFVTQNTDIDKMALEKSTSFYFPHKTIHMLPSEISEGVCSLNPGQKKNAVVCSMYFENGEISYKFDRKTIISHTRYTYDDFDRILEGNEAKESVYTNGKKTDEIIKRAYEFLPKEGVKENQFIKYPVPVLGENGKVEKLILENENTPSQIFVSELMKLCGHFASHKMIEKGTGIFRNQEEEKNGAIYELFNKGHASMGYEYYTHFTSPIRRYVDLIIHRLMFDENIDLNKIINRLNRQTLKAKFLSRRAESMLINQYVEKNIKEKTLIDDFKIINLTEKGILFRNSQLIDCFVKKEKLENEIELNWDSLSDITFDEKNKRIDVLNNQYDFNFEIFFRWTENSKSCNIIVNKKNDDNILKII